MCSHGDEFNYGRRDWWGPIGGEGARVDVELIVTALCVGLVIVLLVRFRRFDWWR